MRHVYRKGLGCLWPKDEAGKIQLDKIPDGSYVTVEVKRPRNIQHHRKLFAMLNIVLQNQEYYKSINMLLSACKLATGHAALVRTKRGDVAIPESIAFDALSQEDFAVFYDAAVNWVIEDVIPGLSRADLDSEVAAALREF